MLYCVHRIEEATSTQSLSWESTDSIGPNRGTAGLRVDELNQVLIQTAAEPPR